MKPNPEYLRRLLNMLRACPSPWSSIGYLSDSGIIPDKQLLFHLQLLSDSGFIEPVSDDNSKSDDSFGFSEGIDDNPDWSDVLLRLTAQGYEFIEALDQKEVWEIIKTQFHSASLRTMFRVGRILVYGYAKELLRNMSAMLRSSSAL